MACVDQYARLSQAASSALADLPEIQHAASMNRLPTASAHYNERNVYTDDGPGGMSAPGHLNKYKRERMEDDHYFSNSAADEQVMPRPR